MDGLCRAIPAQNTLYERLNRQERFNLLVGVVGLGFKAYQLL